MFCACIMTLGGSDTNITLALEFQLQNNAGLLLTPGP